MAPVYSMALDAPDSVLPPPQNKRHQPVDGFQSLMLPPQAIRCSSLLLPDVPCFYYRLLQVLDRGGCPSIRLTSDQCAQAQTCLMAHCAAFRGKAAYSSSPFMWRYSAI